MKRYKQRSLAMFIVFCMIFASIPQAIFATDYDNHWAKNAIEKWSEKGLVKGYEDGNFRPSNPITRGELATILARVFEFEETAHSKEYTDVDAGKWYADSVAKISSAKLMNDNGQTFRPEAPATREEAAYAIAKAYKVTGSTSEAFKDQVAISDWASDSVEALFSKGFISGNPDGTFAPQRTLTRAEVVTMLDKITSGLINVAGTYTEDINGNLVVNTRDVILKDMTISGNLYLTEGIGDGDVTLENITVEGETFVNGGGVNSIKSKGSSFLDGMKVSTKNPVRLLIVGDAVKVEAFPGTTVTLTGNFSNVILPPGVNVIIKDATVGTIFVEPGVAGATGVTNAVITIEEGSTVKNMQADAPVETKGKGKIENLTVNSEGVKTEQKPVKMEIKDKDIKANIAGKEETKESIETAKSVEPSKSSTGGGSSSGGGTTSGGNTTTPGTPVNPGTPGITEKVRFSGVIKYDGKPVKGAEVKINAHGSNYRAETSEDGYFSFYVDAGKTYEISAWIVNDEYEGFYGEKIELANSNKEINIELKKQNVAKILITDSNNRPIITRINLREVDENGKKLGSYRVDNRGNATIILEKPDDVARMFEIYLEDMSVPVGKVEGVKYTGKPVSEYTGSLNWSLGNTIEGMAVYNNGEPAKNKKITLLQIHAHQDNTSWTSWMKPVDIITDNDGKYIFEDVDKNFDYYIQSRYTEGTDCFISDNLNALLVSGEYNEQVVIKKSYSITVDIQNSDSIVDPNNMRIDIMDKNGTKWGMSGIRPGKELIYEYRFGPGEYTITVTTGEDVIVKTLTIIEGIYNYDVLVDLLGEKNERTLNVKLKEEQSVNVAGKKLTAHNVTLGYPNNDQGEGKGQAWADFTNGKATLVIPQDFNSLEAKLFIRDAEGMLITIQDITLDVNEVEVDLANTPDFISAVYLQSTTDSAITLNTAKLYMTDKPDDAIIEYKLKDFDVSAEPLVARESMKLFSGIKLIHGKYFIIVEYSANEIDYELIGEFIFFDKDKQTYELTFDLTGEED